MQEMYVLFIRSDQRMSKVLFFVFFVSAMGTLHA